jgi:hypothetical protein
VSKAFGLYASDDERGVDPMSDATTVTVSLPNEVVEELKALAAARKTTMTYALAEAIRLSKFLADQQAAQKRLVLERPDGMFERVVTAQPRRP